MELQLLSWTRKEYPNHRWTEGRIRSTGEVIAMYYKDYRTNTIYFDLSTEGVWFCRGYQRDTDIRKILVESDILRPNNAAEKLTVMLTR
jgi:hypothetical protein